MINGILKHNFEFRTFLAKEIVAVSRNLVKKVIPSTEYEDYELLKFLGQGSSGQVVCAQNIITKKIVTIKIIKKEILKNRNRLTQLQREIRILNSINFDFLISLDCYFTNTCYVFIVMPYVNGGQFFNLLKQVKKFDELTAKFFAGQVALAIDYLHYMGIIYRDLKPENLVLDIQGYLKLVDFGFAKKVGRNYTYTFCGTSEYLAPEILHNKGYNRSPDWWTFGILLYEMCYGRPPFTANSEYKVYEKILNGHIVWPEHFSSSLKSLIQGLLQVDKTKRLGCMRYGSEDIKKHQWFTTLNWNALWHKKILSPYRLDNSLGSNERIKSNKVPTLKFTVDCQNLMNLDIGNIDFEV